MPLIPASSGKLAANAQSFFMVRILKVAINVAGLLWMICAAILAYGLIVRFPSRDAAMEIIWDNVRTLGILYVLFLTVMTAFNIVIERKLEKRSASNEYFMITVFHALVLIGC